MWPTEERVEDIERGRSEICSEYREALVLLDFLNTCTYDFETIYV